MKKDIHPQAHPQATIRCGCGHTFTIASTIPQMEVEICSHCHPSYTGAKKIVDTAGRVEKFRARLQKTEEMRKSAKRKSF